MDQVIKAYENAKNIYEKLGVDVEKALEKLQNIRISMHCWQGDDVQGFISNEALSGGIQVTGNYPGKSRTPDELRKDLSFALKLIPGKHKVNLHSIYADSDEKVELDKIEPKHFKKWVDWAKKEGLGLDFNPTCFSHPKASSGYTLSSYDDEIRNFWIRHCQKSRKIGEYFGRELGIKAVTNIWIPDGSKDLVVDKLSPRLRLKDSLDKIFSVEVDKRYNVDALESKLFGIGAEAYTVGSNEFYLGYAVKNNKALCLDSGHFHPTEVISDKISAVLVNIGELLLHVSRPIRWDSDHVVILDDELIQIAQNLVRNNLLEKTYIGLDYFDGSINRIAAWVIGMRSMIKALLFALLEPTDYLKKIENNGNYTERLLMLEELKSYPWQAIFDYYCLKNNVPIRESWYDIVKKYEKEVLSERM